MSAVGDLDQLLNQHAAEISALRAVVPEIPAQNGTDWDDIWLLRYVLSFSDVDARVDALKKCIAYRKERADFLAIAASGAPSKHDEKMKRLNVAGFHGRTKFGEPIFIVRAGCSNPTLTMDSCTEEEVLEHLLHERELAFRMCDTETRARRTVVKMISIINMDGVALANIDRRFFKQLGEAGKMSEFIYPQLLGRSAGVKPPSFFHSIFGLLSVFMTKKMLAKFTLCPGPSTDRPTIASCPYASQRFDAASVPTFIGGACTCTERGGCVCGCPNEQLSCYPPFNADGKSVTVQISAGDVQKCFLGATQSNCTLEWNFNIESHGIEFEVDLMSPDGRKTVLVPKHKFKSEQGPQQGSILVAHAGTVVLKFDNTHSMLRGKTVTYSARLVPPPQNGAVSADDAAQKLDALNLSN